ncbi:HigA family addiction module antitoxin [Kangiella marina]|uniref:Addiction module antidote protein, HigA family n=1 Tax=Kangiella marina TaxID=1079178 RepID=A0ABP8IMK8_9GAMM
MRRLRKPTHPGLAFKLDVLEPIGMSISKAATMLGITRKHLSNFVNERVPCTPDLAHRLAIFTETSVASWLNMQNALNIWEEEQKGDIPEVERLEALA